MTATRTTDLLVPEILTDTVQGAFKKRNALVGSIMVSSGAIAVESSMPESGPQVIGKTIRIPYFGTIGSFDQRNEDLSATPKKLYQTYEDATIDRYSLAFEASRWAMGASQLTSDVYDEATRQIVEAAQRCIDLQLVTEGATSPLVEDFYSAGVPHYMTYSDVVRAKARKLGDEQEGIVAMVVHSLVEADLAATVDTTGRPLLTMPVDGTVRRLAGVPLLVSDSLPLTGSTMGALTHVGTGSATYALAGTPTGPWDLVIKATSTGECGAAKIVFSTDGGNTWSAEKTTSATAVATTLIDTAVDSLVGVNGTTGITVTFTSGAGDDLVTNDTWSATANLCVESQLWTRGAGAFWYNANAMQLLTDEDILEDTTIAAMHLYGCPHLYRRRVGGTRPGVVRIKTNVTHYVG